MKLTSAELTIVLLFICLYNAPSHTKTTKRKSRSRAYSRNKKLNRKELPPAFGKTHFIVGFDHNQHEQEKKKNTSQSFSHLSSNNGTIKKALFSPDDNICQTIIDLIKQEQHSIKVAMFSFTDKRIANALIQSARNGIHVEVVTDPNTLHTPSSKIKYLKRNKIPIYIYKPRHRTAINDKMHDKFILFSKNIHDKSLLMTGSYNFTRSAGSNNQENVVLLEDLSFFDQFNKQFNKLKRRSKLTTK